MSGGVNREGINHYNSLIDELITNGKWTNKASFFFLFLYLIFVCEGLAKIFLCLLIKKLAFFSILIKKTVGIAPFVTLFHFDLPQSLQEKYGGPLSRAFM